MTNSQLLSENRQEILALAQQYGAKNVRVFGSVARGEDDEQSDIDFLVEMEPTRSLFDLGGFMMSLQELLGRPVDVVTEDGLKMRIRERVLQEAVAL
ncbi:MAG: nucleotidyltransferase family protein [Chloroflexota bacterium]